MNQDSVLNKIPAVSEEFRLFDQPQTESLLDFVQLVEAIKKAAQEYALGLIVSPERMVVPFPAGGVMLSMPACAGDISMHKLVNVNPSNTSRKMPTIHGQVTVVASLTGKPLFMLDGPEVTARRTAAVSLLAIETFLNDAPKAAMLIGPGKQAFYHLLALHAIYPDCLIFIRGRTDQDAKGFCERHAHIHNKLQACKSSEVPAAVEVVISLTTSKIPTYNEQPSTARLVIGVGAFQPDMAEIGKDTLDGSDVYVDDIIGARHEAGDLIQAKIDWNRVRPLSDALKNRPDGQRPIVFKSVGTGAWDLAACRVAMNSLATAPA